jgi:hypothetical protein
MMKKLVMHLLLAAPLSLAACAGSVDEAADGENGVDVEGISAAVEVEAAETAADADTDADTDAETGTGTGTGTGTDALLKPALPERKCVVRTSPAGLKVRACLEANPPRPSQVVRGIGTLNLVRTGLDAGALPRVGLTIQALRIEGPVTARGPRVTGVNTVRSQTAPLVRRVPCRPGVAPQLQQRIVMDYSIAWPDGTSTTTRGYTMPLCSRPFTE